MRIHRRAFAQMLASLGFSAVPALAEAKTVEVTMKQAPKSRFLPEVVNISLGDTVKWTNPAFVTHSVTFDPGMAATAGDVVLPAGVTPFDSGNIEEDGSFSHTFTVKGTYKYICKFHEAMGMIGTVIVS
ncbi:MAG TPA: plastocyanin/azurin family copper-binding protein [Rhizomicrobium sp.]|nr:plastocyanin/azurin family copper-binding protein [Rhizomicrobium sp.]